MNNFITDIENICAELVNTFHDQLAWEWDDRFQAALAAGKIDIKDNVQVFLKRHLKTIWDNSNTDDAPDVVLDIISYFGGLMPGQVLYTSDMDQDILLCCAWWPWGNRETFSVRVTPYTQKLSDEDKATLINKFMSWFKISEA
jgi:hypothetical protein